jgi:hypothetical protein
MPQLRSWQTTRQGMLQGAGGAGGRHGGKNQRKEDLHKAIWENIHRKQFCLAEEAPMYSGPLRGLFWYNSVTPTAKAILEGTYHYPPDFDEATKEILQECVLISLHIPKNSVSTVINSGDWSNHWCPAREETSLSISGRNFGHYKAGLQLQYVSYLQALQGS